MPYRRSTMSLGRLVKRAASRLAMVARARFPKPTYRQWPRSVGMFRLRRRPNRAHSLAPGAYKQRNTIAEHKGTIQPNAPHRKMPDDPMIKRYREVLATCFGCCRTCGGAAVCVSVFAQRGECLDCDGSQVAACLNKTIRFVWCEVGSVGCRGSSISPAQGLPCCEAIVGALKWRAGVFLGLALTYVTCRA